MRKFLTCVTVTGADNHTDRNEMERISQEFPFVEWGILLSHTREGQDKRYPCRTWIEGLASFKLRYAGHLCGKWVRDWVSGGCQFVTERPTFLPLFQRIQLNVSHMVMKLDREAREQLLDSVKGEPRFIIQCRSVPSWWPNADLDKVDFLYDCSGGKGLLSEWYAPLPNAFCGYAGGLKPENLLEQLERIEPLLKGQMTWVDVESGVRTDDVFNLDKVRQFLKIAQPYVI